MSSRNTHIVSKGFRNYLVSILVLMLLEQICAIIDMLLAGNFLGADAFAALDLAMPIESLFHGLVLLFVGGAGVIAARHVGNQEFDSAHKVLNVAIISSTLFAVLLSVIGYVFFDSLVSWLCPNDFLAGHLYDYLKVYLISFVPIALFNAFSIVLNVDGKPTLIALASAGGVVVDITLDIVFMKYMGMGADGVAWASTLSYVLPAIFFIMYLNHSKKTGFKFIRARSEFGEILKQNMKAGVSFSTPFIITCAMQLIINMVVLKQFGQDGLYVWSVGFQLLSLGIMFLDSIGGTVLVTMGGIFAGSHDTSGLKELLKRCCFVTAYCLLPLIALVCIFPNAILSLFGEDDVLSIPNAELNVILILLFIVPYALLYIKIYLEMALGRDKFATYTASAFFIFCTAATWIWISIDPSELFLAMVVSAAVFVVLETIHSEILRRKKHPDYSKVFLIPNMPQEGTLYLSVPYSIEGRNNAMREVAEFLDGRDLNPSVAMAVNLSCEELMLNLQQQNEGKGDEYFYDIFIFDNKSDIKVTVRDAGSPFNPIRKFEKSAVEAIEEGDEMDLSLQILNKMCKDLNYNYMYGQNVISMTFGVKNN